MVQHLENVLALEQDIASALKIARYESVGEEPGTFLRFALSECVRRLKADRGSIFLANRTTNVLSGFLMTGISDPNAISLPLGEGIVGEVVTQGQMLNIRNAYLDPRFFKAIDNSTGYKTKAILCGPITKSLGNSPSPRDILGAMQVLNPKSKEHFDDIDERSLRTLLDFTGARLRQLVITDEFRSGSL